MEEGKRQGYLATSDQCVKALLGVRHFEELNIVVRTLVFNHGSLV